MPAAPALPIRTSWGVCAMEGLSLSMPGSIQRISGDRGCRFRATDIRPASRTGRALCWCAMPWPAWPVDTIPAGAVMASIRLEHAPVVDAKRRVLIFLARDTIAGNQEFDVGSHKAAERVFRGADDRLASDIEARVHQSWAASALLEGRE